MTLLRVNCSKIPENLSILEHLKMREELKIGLSSTYHTSYSINILKLTFGIKLFPNRRIFTCEFNQRNIIMHPIKLKPCMPCQNAARSKLQMMGLSHIYSQY